MVKGGQQTAACAVAGPLVNHARQPTKTTFRMSPSRVPPTFPGFGSRRSCIERHGVSARTAASAADSDCGGAHYRMFPAPTTSSGSSCSDNSGSPTCMTSGSTGSLPYGASFNDSASRPGSRAAAVLPYLSTTGALLLGTVLFTDAAAAVRPHVVVPGLYVGAAMAAAAGAECVRRHAEARRGLRPARVVICSEVGRGGGGRALQGARAAWRAARGLAGAAGRSGRPVMELLQRLLGERRGTWRGIWPVGGALRAGVTGVGAPCSIRLLCSAGRLLHPHRVAYGVPVMPRSGNHPDLPPNPLHEEGPCLPARFPLLQFRRRCCP